MPDVDVTATSPAPRRRRRRRSPPRFQLRPLPDAPLSVVVDDVHITYTVFQEARVGLRQVFARGFRGRTRRKIPAVRGISLRVQQGEVIGIIGPNGSGKSTLLRAIAGLLPVTSGAIYACARPTLLGVGAVLQPALSGRRNIYMGGLALGLSQDQINRRYDEIVAFSGLRDFINLPLKTYSSGMRARLHFSIATAVTPEILLIDEALAVGDRAFKRRSARRIAEIQGEAGTIFLVSHGMGEIRRMCNRAVWIERGRVVMAGDPAEVVAAYEEHDDQAADEPGAALFSESPDS